MKAFLAFLGGFGLSLAIFGAGAATAIAFLHVGSAEPRLSSQDAAPLWSIEPRTVDTGTQDFERVASVAAKPEAADARFAQTDDAGIDATTTAALSIASPDPALRSPDEEALAAAHVQWCGSRYRSYRERDDSYTAYSGDRRRCMSPYSDDASGEVSFELEGGDRLVEDAGEDSLIYASGGDSVSGDHVDYCFSRYRSYRPADNTYQPFGGGPRRLCQ